MGSERPVRSTTRGVCAVLLWVSIACVPASPGGALAEESLADLDARAAEHSRAGRRDEARALYERAIAVRERTLGPEHPDLARSLNDLAVLLYRQGRHKEAEPLYLRALAIREAALGATHPLTAQSLNNLAVLYRAQLRHDDALPLHQRALAIREQALGAEHPETAQSLDNLANLLLAQGRTVDALPLSQRALAIREKALGAEHPDTAQSLNNLATIYLFYGRHSDAVPLYLRAVPLREKSLGPDHPEVARSIDNLANAYVHLARYDEALPLLRRALEIREKAFGSHHAETAIALRNLGVAQHQLGQATEARESLQLSLLTFERVAGPDHIEVARTLRNLAVLEALQERYAEATAMMERALAILERSIGPEQPEVAAALSFLSELQLLQGDHQRSLALAQKAVGLQERVLAPQHPDRAIGLNFLAMSYEAAALANDGSAPDGMDQALAMARAATAIRRARARDMGRGGDRGQAAARGEITRNRAGFAMHIRLLAARGGGMLDGDSPDLVESFEVVQIARASDTAAAIDQMAARVARGDDELAQWVRRRQDVLLRLRYLDGELTRALAGSDSASRAKTAAVQAELRQAEDQLNDIDRTLADRFPQYRALTSQEPLALAEARTLLAPTEAMLSYLVGEKESYLWVVRADRQAVVRLPIGERELDDAVGTLRRTLDVQQTQGKLLQYPATVAHALYGKVLAPAAALLDGARHLLIVPDGALHGLPFSVLIDQPPRASEPDATAWLVRRYAFSTLPSEASLKALRQFAKRAAAPEPFVGFGDPIFKGEPNSTRSLAALYTPRGVADVDQLSRLAPLPESAIEITTIARALGAGTDSIFLRASATESQVKRLDLRRYRTVAFATHGFTAGEIRGSIEPALALTPPATASTEDDGLLTASEIARLQLNADWIILSACNTAAPDGRVAREGLSGLARSFFFAGSRSLLVSHWPVDSRAAASLTAGTLREIARQPGLRKDEALRRAMLNLLADKRYRHPIYWAPFVMVGA